MGDSAPDCMALWAKGAPTAAGDPYHPLACHLLDVAAVAAALWRGVVPRAVQTWVADGIGVPVDDAGRWAAFLAGIHDVGKGSVAFFDRRQKSKVRHGVVSVVAIEDVLLECPYALDMRVASCFATAVGGHHGVFPCPDEFEPACLPRHLVGGQSWSERRRDLIDLVAREAGIVSAERPTRIDAARAIWFAGFVSVADWIGSNAKYFRFAAPDGSHPGFDELPAYARAAAEQARAALADLGWTSGREAPSPAAWSDLFPNLPIPNAMQQAVIDLADGLDEPGLVVVEAPMGQGKTEAAFVLADRAMVDLGLGGCYIALPTQATANQMLGRFASFLSRRYTGDLVNTVLLHGRSLLVHPPVVPSEVAPDDGTEGREATVRAAEWFCQRKRGLLAPFGVGTIDQALLAVLPTRHHFVRLFGLAGKTVIVDEVHAYDAYMSSLLERLLAWLAALGCRVMLLSATLPRLRLDALVAAYASGLGGASDVIGEQAPYPRLTLLTAGRRQEVALAGRGDGLDGRSVRVERLEAAGGEAPAAIAAALEREVAAGGCAAVVCNTVSQAQEVYRAVAALPAFQGVASDGGPVVDLLHARFMAGDRRAREERALRRFGPPGDSVERPDRAVLVATQVIEQSLDLDFDLLVSMFAPIDLLLQRSGRLHRHLRLEPRPPGLAEPRVLLVSPPLLDGVPCFDPGTANVYAPHVLLRSWLALHGRDRIVVPGDLEDLIERVYDDRPCPADVAAGIADCWAATRAALDKELAADRKEATKRWVKPPWYSGDLSALTRDPLEEDAPDLHGAFQALTRLGGPSLEVACLEADGADGLRWPDGRPFRRSVRPDDAETLRILERSVPVARVDVVRALAEALSVPSGWRDHPMLARHRVVGLDQSGEARVGEFRLRLDPEVGLEILSDRLREGRW